MADQQPSGPERTAVGESRRDFIRTCSLAAPLLLLTLRSETLAALSVDAPYNPKEHRYGMGIDVAKCIGCGRCADACKNENNVLREPFYFRTWVERYVISSSGETTVDSPNGGIDGFPPTAPEKG